MLENAWESHATALANAPNTPALIEAVEHLVKVAKIDLNKPSRVVYARDTRPSGASLVRALEDGLKAIGAETRDAGVTTTPVLHYLVRAINTKGTKDEYGPDSEEGYVAKLTAAFKKLIVGPSIYSRITSHSTLCRPAKLLYPSLSLIAPMG
jgi:phosphoacetylglucosamine mutase